MYLSLLGGRRSRIYLFVIFVISCFQFYSAYPRPGGKEKFLRGEKRGKKEREKRKGGEKERGKGERKRRREKKFNQHTKVIMNIAISSNVWILYVYESVVKFCTFQWYCMHCTIISVYWYISTFDHVPSIISIQMYMTIILYSLFYWFWLFWPAVNVALYSTYSPNDCLYASSDMQQNVLAIGYHSFDALDMPFLYSKRIRLLDPPS